MFEYSATPPQLAASTSSTMDQLHLDALQAWHAVSNPPLIYTRPYRTHTVPAPPLAAMPWLAPAPSTRPRMPPTDAHNSESDREAPLKMAASSSLTHMEFGTTSSRNLAADGDTSGTDVAVSTSNHASTPILAPAPRTALSALSNLAQAATASDSTFAGWPHSGLAPAQLYAQLTWQYTGQPALQYATQHRPETTVASAAASMAPAMFAAPASAVAPPASEWTATPQFATNSWAAESHSSVTAMYPALWSWQSPHEPSPAHSDETTQTLRSSTLSHSFPHARHSLEGSTPRVSPMSDGRPELARQVAEHIMLSALNDTTKWSRQSSPQMPAMPENAASIPQSTSSEGQALHGQHNLGVADVASVVQNRTAASDEPGNDNADELAGEPEAGNEDTRETSVLKVRKQRRKNGEPPRDLAQRRYACDLCVGEPKLFARPSALRIHKLTHTKEKPHVCPDCKRAFAIASNLKRHRRLHLPGGTKETALLAADNQPETAAQATDAESRTDQISAASASQAAVVPASINSGRLELPPAMVMAPTTDFLGLRRTQATVAADPLAHLTATSMFPNLAWPTGIVADSFDQ
ncbi:hypothetical protein OIV83_006396 [Microbotryomycetes sp. JL201]|nr:hypothetical protein OIV83_006396 [Microbotryomycetes sp. JL201]